MQHQLNAAFQLKQNFKERLGRIAPTKPLLLLLAMLASTPSFATNVYQHRELSEAQLIHLYETVLWDGLRYADKEWHESDTIPQGGMWGSGRSDQMNEGIRAISEMVLVTAICERFTASGTSAERAEYLRKAKAAMRYAVASHVSGSQKCTDGKPWGKSWQSAYWAGTMAWGSWLMWDEIDSALRSDIERVVASEADRFLGGKPPRGSFNDTKAEENGWNLTCISVAANMFPKHPHAAAWREKAIEYAMNTLSAPQDANDTTMVDGKPVRDWFAGENVHPDFTLENHGFFHPAYVGCSSYFLTQTAMHFKYAHQPIPQAASHHLMDTWGMLETIMLPYGEPAYPQGMDWELHGIPYINLFAALATWQTNRHAAMLERNYLQYMRGWQEMLTGDLATPGSRLGLTRHAICAEQAAYGLLAHKLFGPSAKPLSPREAEKIAAGVRERNYIQLITHRTGHKFVSFSWTNRLMGLLAPIGRGHEKNPFFTTPLVNGLIGSYELSPRGDTRTTVVQHEWKTTDDGFETSGTLLLNGGRLEQRLQIISTGEHTVVYEDCVIARSNLTVLQERGVPIAIENDRVSGGTRHIIDAKGKTTCDWQHPDTDRAVCGTWANVDDRMGVLSLAGAGIHYLQATNYTPGISLYQDVLSGSFSKEGRSFKAGEVVSRRVVVIYLEVSARDTARLAKRAKIERTAEGEVLRLDLPERGKRTITLSAFHRE